MSHQDYVAACDEDQLERLIELANERLKTIRESGYVSLWVVNDDWSNLAWFAENAHKQAVDAMIEMARERSTKDQNCSWNVTKQRFRPEEAAELVTLALQAKPSSA